MEKLRVLVEKSPCETCTKVDNPKNCESKQCKEWRQWWIKRWELIRIFARMGSN